MATTLAKAARSPAGERSAEHLSRPEVLTSIGLGRFSAWVAVVESYVERPPLPGLAAVVRTVWIQRTGEAAYEITFTAMGGAYVPERFFDFPQAI